MINILSFSGLIHLWVIHMSFSSWLTCISSTNYHLLKIFIFSSINITPGFSRRRSLPFSYVTHCIIQCDYLFLNITDSVVEISSLILIYFITLYWIILNLSLTLYIGKNGPKLLQVYFIMILAPHMEGAKCFVFLLFRTWITCHLVLSLYFSFGCLPVIYPLWKYKWSCSWLFAWRFHALDYVSPPWVEPHDCLMVWVMLRSWWSFESFFPSFPPWGVLWWWSSLRYIRPNGSVGIWRWDSFFSGQIQSLFDPSQLSLGGTHPRACVILFHIFQWIFPPWNCPVLQNLPSWDIGTCTPLGWLFLDSSLLWRV